MISRDIKLLYGRMIRFRKYARDDDKRRPTVEFLPRLREKAPVTSRSSQFPRELVRPNKILQLHVTSALAVVFVGMTKQVVAPFATLRGGATMEDEEGAAG